MAHKKIDQNKISNKLNGGFSSYRDLGVGAPETAIFISGKYGHVCHSPCLTEALVNGTMARW